MDREDASKALLERARRWALGDPDERTRDELSKMVSEANLAALEECFARPLKFGTAGLRGIVGPGPGRMNRAVVIRATRALADFLLASERDARTLPVVVGFDARPDSQRFAEDVAGVLAGAGLAVRYFSAPVPTPLVAYAQRQLSGIAAVVITASHNPPEYNGYKLYGRDASQITPPADREIEQRICRLGPACEIERQPFGLGMETERAAPVPESFPDRYLAELDALRPPGAADRSLRIVYTALHGVGESLVRRALERAGFDDVVSVPQQADPDGKFPTVLSPNPEEPEALELALELGRRAHGDLLLANDPDVDRLAVCVSTPSGRWVRLTGNQVGLLLADFILEHSPRAPLPLVLSTIVSSPMLADIASRHGARYERTLTGFKWVWKAALTLERSEGVRFAFGYEEALGYGVGRLVRDKDGISAAVFVAELAARCRARGQSLVERMQELSHRHGLWASAQRNLVRPGARGVREISAAIDRLAGQPPETVSGRSVEQVIDYRSGADGRPEWLGEAELVELRLADGSRVLARPSGTEPKLKIYVDLRQEVGSEESFAAAEQRAVAEAGRMADEIVEMLGDRGP